MTIKGRQLAAALKLQMTFQIMVYLVLDRRITVGNGVFGTENDVSVITLCFHSKMLGLLMHLWWIHTGFLAVSDIIHFSQNWYFIDPKETLNLFKSLQNIAQSTYLDCRGVDNIYTIFFENRSVVIEIESSEVGGETEKKLSPSPAAA